MMQFCSLALILSSVLSAVFHMVPANELLDGVNPPKPSFSDRSLYVIAVASTSIPDYKVDHKIPLMDVAGEYWLESDEIHDHLIKVLKEPPLH